MQIFIHHSGRKTRQNIFKLEKHSESSDLRQAYRFENFKVIQNPGFLPDHPQN